MKFNDLIQKQCSDKDLIIVRVRATKTEIKAPNISPYKKIFNSIASRVIIDNWRDGENCVIVVI